MHVVGAGSPWENLQLAPFRHPAGDAKKAHIAFSPLAAENSLYFFDDILDANSVGCVGFQFQVYVVLRNKSGNLSTTKPREFPAKYLLRFFDAILIADRDNRWPQFIST